jgi:predicted nucleotidyltransferase
MAADAHHATLQLADAEAREVRRIVDALIPGNEVWVFGSRATGRARPFSDLDLLVV